MRIEWDGQHYYSVADFQATGQGQGSLEVDPLFVNPPGGDFRPRRNGAISPIIDSGAPIQGYADTFAGLYGLDIAVDAGGAPRPQGPAVDMGAFESDGSVVPANNPPITADTAVTTDQDTPVVGTVTATDADGDPLACLLLDDPAHGAVQLAFDGVFTYAPESSWHGTDSFAFRAFDGWEHSPLATVTVTVVNLKAPGDANGDGAVDVLDLSIVSNSFGRPNSQWWDGDFNEDGFVDVLDLAILSNNFGRL